MGQEAVGNDVEPHLRHVPVPAGEDRGVVEGEHRHVLEARLLRVLDSHPQGEYAEPAVAEEDGGVTQHQPHDRRPGETGGTGGGNLRGEGSVGVPVTARKRGERGDEAVDAVDHEAAVVEWVRVRDLDAVDEDLDDRGVGCQTGTESGGS